MNGTSRGFEEPIAGQVERPLGGSPLGLPAELGGHPEADHAERGQLPPKARFTHAYKRGLLAHHAEEAPVCSGLPQGTSIAPDNTAPAPGTTAASATSPRASPPSATGGAPSQPQAPLTSASPDPAPRRQLKHPLDLGVPAARGAPYDSDEEGDADADVDADPLHRGAKAVRLSTSKIQGRAEPRRPRIGPQYQAFVPPWPPGQ
ncbi:hypothetical protein PLESTF_001765100 [Pleodorina starrii]|nr:hypothetical protein PLESTF_001765100 [Pleodorina starrii]